MKLKMKTTATLLIAILMISAFAVAIPVMAITDYNYGFQTSLPGDSVERSVENPHEPSTWSIKQVIVDGTGYSDARVKFNYYEALDSLDSVDFFAFLEEQLFTTQVGPYVSMSLDTTGDEVADSWLMQGNQIYEIGIWEGFHGLDGSTLVAVTTEQAGYGSWPVEGVLFSDLKSLPLTGSIYDTWGECTVLEIKVGIGSWMDGTNTIAYVDDVVITGLVTGVVTYDFESASTYVEGIIDGYILTVNIDPVLGGSVVLDPEPDPEYEYDADTEVTLYAIPETGYMFDSWTGVDSFDGGIAGITMDSHEEVIAHFKVIPQISIDVDKASIALSGTIGERLPNLDTLKVTSHSNVNIDVTVELIGEDVDFFTACLLIEDESAPFAGTFPVGLTPDEFEVLNLGLDLTSKPDTGTYSATLVFWAEETV